MILFVNSCVREKSRTKMIADALINKLNDEVTEINLYTENLKPLSKETLNKRTELASNSDFSDDMFKYAKQFADADIIVIAAPYWDLSFPAELKTYIENIYVIGIVSKYNKDGLPIGLCKAKKLYYVTTAGGPYDPNYSYNYIKAISTDFFGIKDTKLIKAEMLDIDGYSAEDIVNKTIDEIEP